MSVNSDLIHVKKLIRSADAIVIGGGSGLSSASGYNHYHWSSYFEEQLKPFIDQYGFKSPFDGFYYLFSDYESQWGYYAAYIKAMYDAPIGESYRLLEKLTHGKPRFIISSNIDMQFDKVFNEDELCNFQGSFGYLQCSQPCHDNIILSKSFVNEMVAHLDNQLRIPTAMVPRCSLCGRVLVPWVRDDTFLQGKYWKQSFHNYQNFIDTWVYQKKANVLLLELGVGDMTPSVIKLPFWEMTYQNKNIHYLRINKNTESVPQHIASQATNIKADILDVFKDLDKLSLEDD